MAKCIGCGAKLQNTDPNKPGYVDLVVSIERGEDTYCKRCFDIIHHNKKYKPIISDIDYYKKISVIKNEKALVLLMIDIFDIYGTIIPNLKDAIGDNKVVVLVNKVDLLPKDIHLKNIELRVRELLKEYNIEANSVYLISAKNKKNIDSVINKISKLKYPKRYSKWDKKQEAAFKNCYLLGTASVGKSTFMNAVTSIYLEKNKNFITTSDQFQTTLDFIKVPLDKESYFIDTPGLINKKSFGAYLDYESIKKVTPGKYIKPKTFQLKSNQTIFLAGLARIDFLSENINASFYTSNDLYLHRTKTTNADEVYLNNKDKLFVPPYNIEEAARLGENQIVTFNKDAGIYDLIISGIGFVHLNVKESLSIKVTLSSKVDVKLVETFF